MDIYTKAEEIEKYFNDYLSGNGFNYDFTATEYPKQNTIHIDTFYQCMNDNGYYVGSIPVKAIYKYDTNGECAELVSVRYRKEYNGCYIGEYIGDFFFESAGIFR